MANRARDYAHPEALARGDRGAPNLQAPETEKKRRAARELERVQDLKALADRIHAIDITLRERVASGDTLYGSISAREIVAALTKEEINIDPEMIRLEEPIKTLGVHRVPVRLHAQVETELKVWVVELKETDAKAEE